MVERITGQRPVGDEDPNSVPRRVLTLLAVMVGWVIFRAENLAHAGGMLSAMFSLQGGSLPAEIAVSFTTRVQITLIIGALVVFLPRSFVGGITIPESTDSWAAAARVGLMLFAFPYALALAATGTFSPFLYYQF